MLFDHWKRICRLPVEIVLKATGEYDDGDVSG